MEQSKKDQIISSAKDYLAENKLSANDLARMAKVNPSYLSNMLNGNYTIITNDKPVEISDKWFVNIAGALGMTIKESFIQLQQTIQFIQGVAALKNCKEQSKTGLIIGHTGVGKTIFIDKFCSRNPQHTYRITVSSVYLLDDVLNELCEKIGNIEATYNRHNKLKKIMNRLRDIHMSGGRPIIIFDEGENMESQTLKAIKALFDGVKDFCSVVMIGTEQLLNKLLNLRKRNRDAIPQLYRRFKAGTVYIMPIDKQRDFKPFFESYVADKGLRKLLMEQADNYGELCDYLEPVLREADRLQQPLTEDLFRTMFNMPK